MTHSTKPLRGVASPSASRSWAGATVGGTLRWEFGAGLGWRGYSSVGRPGVGLFCVSNDPGASAATGYASQRIGVRGRGRGRSAWTMGVWLCATEDLATREVSYSYERPACDFLGRIGHPMTQRA